MARNVAVFAIVLAALAALPSLAGGKGLLVLQCGSDWCVSGEDVRKVFEGSEFRKLLAGKYELAVYDDMEDPPPKVKAENERLARWRVASRRFPAITCLTEEPRRFFAQLENIPFDVTPQKLLSMVEEAAKNKNAAEKLFKHGRGRGQNSADSLGKGFEILESQVGEFDRPCLREGPLAWEAQWKHLEDIDENDRYGWRRRFTMGYGFDLVDAATDFALNGDIEKWTSFINEIRAIPTNNLSVVQRQCLEIVELAYSQASSTGQGSFSASDSQRLHRVLDMGRDTIWGQYALGRLILSGEKIETGKPYRAEVLERPETAQQINTQFKLDEVASRVAAMKPGKEGFSDSDKRDIALYAVLRRIGEDGWNALKSRPGSVRFIREFFRNREWMEDFAWSGHCSNWKDAILTLESLYFQDGGRWIKRGNAGQMFATATALEKPGADEPWLADWLDAYRSTALSNRLHKTAYSQQVWQWRYAIKQIHGPRGIDDPPNQQRFLDTFYNVSATHFGEAHKTVPYRPFNCFNKSVHGPEYYKAWECAGEWPKRRYSYIVGGVCVELSTFGSRCSNAHGLPSVPVGQPGHLAYTRRMPDGKWVVDNFITPPTGFPALWPGADHWTYTVASENAFEGDRERRLDADRYLEIAHLADSQGKSADAIAKVYRRACNTWPGHYTAWREYSAWISRNARTLDEHRTFARAAIKGLDGLRHPLWDLLTPYFKRVFEEGGGSALVGELAEFAPLLRQNDEMLLDNGDFSVATSEWTKPLKSSPALMEKTVAVFAAAQYGTKTYFTQVLGWCAPFLFEDEKRADRFLRLLPKLADKFSDKMRATAGGAKAVIEARRERPNLGPFILAAEDSGDMIAFKQFAEMERKIGVQPAGLDYNDRDFNGVLVSSEGMLTLQGSAPGDTPHLHPRTIDASRVNDFTFCALGYKAEPSATVVLAGPCELRGIVVVNTCPDKSRCEKQLPMEVEISEDGRVWDKVFFADKLRSSYRIEFKYGDSPRARQVRVTLKAGLDGKLEQLEYFHLSKILVYGRKLY